MKKFLYASVITTFSVLTFAPVFAETLCTKNTECSANQVCTATLKNCQGELCIGTCQDRTSGTLGLAPSITLSSVFINSVCTDSCKHILWFSIHEGINKKLSAGYSIKTLLSEYNPITKQETPVLSLAEPLLSTSNSIDSFSIELPRVSDALYPHITLYTLKISYNLEDFTWFLYTRQTSSQSTAYVAVTDINPTASEKTAFIAAESAKFTIAPLSDIEPNSLTSTAVSYLQARGIVTGYSDGTFRPANHINRAEAATLLIKTRFGQPSLSATPLPFTDTEANAWYTPFIQKAVLERIIEGYSNGTFQPAATINTAEFLKILSQTFALQVSASIPYIDVPENAWYNQYAANAAYYSLMPLRPNYALYPAMNVTREEFAIALYTVLETIPDLQQ